MPGGICDTGCEPRSAVCPHPHEDTSETSLCKFLLGGCWFGVDSAGQEVMLENINGGRCLFVIPVVVSD